MRINKSVKTKLLATSRLLERAHARKEPQSLNFISFTLSPPAPAIQVGNEDAGVPQEVYLEAALNLHLPMHLPVTDWKNNAVLFCLLNLELLTPIDSFQPGTIQERRFWEM